MNRLYLPAEALEAAGVKGVRPDDVLADPAIDQACRWVAKIAHDHYQQADSVLASRPGGRLRTPRLMSAVYAAILKTMEAEGWAPPRFRASLGKTRLLWLVLTRGLI
jgi:phytoene synthase